MNPSGSPSTGQNFKICPCLTSITSDALVMPKRVSTWTTPWNLMKFGYEGCEQAWSKLWKFFRCTVPFPRVIGKHKRNFDHQLVEHLQSSWVPASDFPKSIIQAIHHYNPIPLILNTPLETNRNHGLVGNFHIPLGSCNGGVSYERGMGWISHYIPYQNTAIPFF